MTAVLLPEPARRRVRLDPASLAALVLALLRALPPEPQADVAAVLRRLRSEGLLDRATGQPPDWIRQLLAPVAAPHRRIDVQTFRAGRLVQHVVWALPGQATLGELHADDTFTLTPAEPAFLEVLVAQLVGLAAPAHGEPAANSGESPQPVGEIVIHAEFFDALLLALHQDDRPTVAALLDEHRPDAATLGLLLDLNAHRAQSWRVLMSWLDPDQGEQHRALCVRDAGAEGLWSTSGGQGGDDLVLRRAAPAEVWEQLRRHLQR